jgi:hypothetical protein
MPRCASGFRSAATLSEWCKSDPTMPSPRRMANPSFTSWTCKTRPACTPCSPTWVTIRAGTSVGMLISGSTCDTTRLTEGLHEEPRPAVPGNPSPERRSGDTEIAPTETARMAIRRWPGFWCSRKSSEPDSQGCDRIERMDALEGWQSQGRGQNGRVVERGKTFGHSLCMTQVKVGNEIACMITGWFKSTATVLTSG